MILDLVAAASSAIRFDQLGLDPVALYPQLVARHQAPPLRPPLNRDARLRAGFTEAELAWLESPDGL